MFLSFEFIDEYIIMSSKVQVFYRVSFIYPDGPRGEGLMSRVGPLDVNYDSASRIPRI